MELIQFISCYEDKGSLKPTPRWDYFMDWTNWLELPLFVASMIFVVVTDKCLCPEVWNWQLGTIVMFLAWIDLLTFLYKFPKFGVYMLMIQHIVFKFIRVLAIAALFSVAFGFAFYMTFYDPNIPVRQVHASFAVRIHNFIATFSCLCRHHHLQLHGCLY